MNSVHKRNLSNRLPYRDDENFPKLFIIGLLVVVKRGFYRQCDHQRSSIIISQVEIKWRILPSLSSQTWGKCGPTAIRMRFRISPKAILFREFIGAQESLTFDDHGSDHKACARTKTKEKKCPRPFRSSVSRFRKDQKIEQKDKESPCPSPVATFCTDKAAM